MWGTLATRATHLLVDEVPSDPRFEFGLACNASGVHRVASASQRGRGRGCWRGGDAGGGGFTHVANAAASWSTSFLLVAVRSATVTVRDVMVAVW